MKETPLDELPEPLLRLYLLFWRLPWHHRRRGGGWREAGLSDVKAMLAAEEVRAGGTYHEPEFKPLLDASAEEVGDAARRALSDDAPGDFKQLVARAFELAWARGQRLDYEVVWSLQNEWPKWPDEERQALKDALMFLWRDAIAKGDVDLAGEVAQNVAEIGLSLVPFFEAWLESGTSSHALYDALDWNSARWEKPSDESRWLCRPQVLERVEADFFNASGKEAEDISRLHNFLRWLCEK